MPVKTASCADVIRELREYLPGLIEDAEAGEPEDLRTLTLIGIALGLDRLGDAVERLADTFEERHK